MKEKEGEGEESERPRAFHEATSERTSERDSGPRESAGPFCRDETDPWISAGLPIAQPATAEAATTRAADLDRRGR